MLEMYLELGYELACGPVEGLKREWGRQEGKARQGASSPESGHHSLEVTGLNGRRERREGREGKRMESETARWRPRLEAVGQGLKTMLEGGRPTPYRLKEGGAVGGQGCS